MRAAPHYFQVEATKKQTNVSHNPGQLKIQFVQSDLIVNSSYYRIFPLPAYNPR